MSQSLNFSEIRPLNKMEEQKTDSIFSAVAGEVLWFLARPRDKVLKMAFWWAAILDKRAGVFEEGSSDLTTPR